LIVSATAPGHEVRLEFLVLAHRGGPLGSQVPDDLEQRVVDREQEQPDHDGQFPPAAPVSTSEDQRLQLVLDLPRR